MSARLPIRAHDLSRYANRSLEQAVLAVLLDGRTPTAMATVRGHLGHPLVMHTRDHALIYQACLDLDDDGQQVDATAVGERLRRDGFAAAMDRMKNLDLLQRQDQLDRMSPQQRRALYRWRDQDAASEFHDSVLSEIGGLPALAELGGAFAGSAGLEQNARSLADLYRRRQIARMVWGLSDRLEEAGADPVAEIQSLATSAARYTVDERQAITIGQAVGLALERHDEIRDGKRRRCATWGIPELDEAAPLYGGRQYVLAATPGGGKSVLGMQAAVSTGQAGGHALVVSLEMTGADLGSRYAAAVAGVSMHQVDNGWLSEAHRQRCEELRGHDHVMIEEWEGTANQLATLLMGVVQRTKPDLIVLDYVQNISAEGRQLDHEAISKASGVMRRIAKDHDVASLIISQTRRDTRGQSRDKDGQLGLFVEPQMSDLKGSGKLEEDAGTIIFLWRRDHEGEPKVTAKIAKNRNGPLRRIDLRFEVKRSRFVPFDQPAESRAPEPEPEPEPEFDQEALF